MLVLSDYRQFLFALSRHVTFVIVLVNQDHLSSHSSSEPGMIVLEGDTDISSTNQEDNFEANKKTDELTGYSCHVKWNCCDGLMDLYLITV